MQNTQYISGKGFNLIINNVGHNHCHDNDFIIERPDGSGDYLLLLITSRSVFNINGTVSEFPENTVFLFKKGTPQYYKACKGKTFSNDWVHFDFESEEEKQQFQNLDIPFDTPVRPGNLSDISFLIKLLAAEFYSKCKFKSNSSKHYLYIIFNKISELIYSEQNYLNCSSYEMLASVRNKIYARPFEPRTVESSAHEVRMSVSGFQHQYKEAFGVSYINDVINSKVEYAKQYLTRTNLSIKKIAEMCGYNTNAHFYRQFKSLTGMTPQEYRMKTKDT